MLVTVLPTLPNKALNNYAWHMVMDNGKQKDECMIPLVHTRQVELVQLSRI